jgi:hypothetical protein
VADGSVAYASLTEWRATGHGLEAVADGADLEDPGNGLFGLNAASPARSAGAAAHSIDHDREAVSRSAPPAIGAYEGTAQFLSESRRFLFGMHADLSGGDQDFVAVTGNLAVIAELRAQLVLPESQRQRFINGPVQRGGLGHNLAWDWHFVPDAWVLGDISIEACQGTPPMVEADLAYWVDRVGRFCPSGAYVKAEL